MKIAFATTCRDRAYHLQETLPKNLADISGYSDSVIVVLDYNDSGDVSKFVQDHHAKDLDSGRLVYYRTDEPPKFHMAHAKNMAHRCALMEEADVLVNLDADNFTGYDFAQYVADKFVMAVEDREPIFLGTRGNHRGPGDLVSVRTPPGCFGRIGVTRDAFRHAGGYDEIFSDWSPDDKDFGNRLKWLGYNWRQIRPVFLDAIRHGNPLRHKDYVAVNEVNILKARQNLGVVNAGQIGTGIVRRNFSSEAIEIRSIPTRVFGIGLHKTGTTSLHRAFQIMGLDSAHWASPHWSKYIWDEMHEHGRSRTLEMHYALSDLPIPLLYQKLGIAYPGSKFVLTIRDEDEWIASIKTHWHLRKSWDNDVFSNIAHYELYGTTEFDEAVFRARYRRHNDDVRSYFAARPNALLVLDLSQAKMRDLCRFLDVPVIAGTFPHSHKSSDQPKYQGFN